jgi:ATP-dependent phosphofructokinase / diphosphate-dependent phosphofructokinase
MRIGILTGGGDAPGLNAAIRAVVKAAANQRIETIGIEDGFRGLIEPNRWRCLTPSAVTGILRQGGTILGTTNQGNPLSYNTPGDRTRDYSDACVKTLRTLSLDALIVIGGDGTLAIADALHKRGVPLVAIPKTIDNDVVETAATIGFDSAVSMATEAVDRLHTTAEAHHRIMVLEVMGRYTGWIGLHAGVAGGADVILIPEIPFDLERVAHHIVAREQLGARFSIAVVAEGAIPVGGRYTVLEGGTSSKAERLGGVGAHIATELARLTNREARSVLLGHLQRGGDPTSVDRILATRFGAKALELAVAGQFGVMVALRAGDLVAVELQNVVGRMNMVPRDSDTVQAARAVGIEFGG